MDAWSDWHCHRKVLRRSQWARALYIDFEGRAIEGEPPALLGVLYSSDGIDWLNIRFVFDPDCMRVAEELEDGSIPATYDDALGWLLECSGVERRPIVSWSCHDIRWVKRLTNGAPFRYRNAIATAKRWRRQAHPDVVGDNSLARYLDWIGYQRPHDPIDVGATIRQIRNTAKVTDVVKRKWAALTLRNDHDLLGMRDVLRQARRLP